MDRTAVRVALRFASDFQVGDHILYGKYKNKRAILKSFGQDEKGHPTVDIVPEGSKKVVTLKLYTIWKAPAQKPSGS